MPAWAPAITLVYGILVLLGGVFGYMKARSRPSLAMGGTLGVLLIIAAALGFAGWGLAPHCAAGLAAFLLVFFSMRYARKKKLMPGGVLAVLSLIAFLANLVAVIRAH
jgi:uncharacterized membrane protein (UPF0136 family)